MKNKTLILSIQLLFFITVSGILKSQNNFSDSLLIDSLYNNTKTDNPRNKINALISLSKYYLYSSPDSSEKYLNKALIISRTNNLQKEEIKILSNLGILKNEQGNIDNAVKFFNSSLKIAKNLNDTASIISAIGNMGNSNMYLGKYEKAIENFTEVIQFSKARNDFRMMAISYGALGNLYFQIKNPDKALYYYELSKEKFEYLNIETGIALTLMNIANVYHQTERYNESSINYSKANTIFVKNNNFLNSAKCLSGIARIYSYQNKYYKSNETELKALKIYKDYEANIDIVNSYSFIASNYILQKKYKNAIILLDSAYKKAFKNNYYTQLEKITNSYRISFDSLRNYKNAYYYSVLNKLYNDSIFNSESDEKFSELEVEFETSQKEQKIKLLKKNEELLNKENKNRLISAIALIITILLGTLIFILINNRAKLKAKQKSIETEHKLLRTQMNPHFIFNALLAIESFMYKNDLDKSAEYLSNFAKLMRLILESSRKNFISLGEELEILNYYIGFQKLRNKVDFNSKINISENIDIENTLIPPMLIQPFIENAIEHGFSQETKNALLKISFKLKDNYIYIDVTDNGTGINNTNNSAKESHSLAIQITKERLNIISDKKQRKYINFTIQDLSDIDPDLKGTKVSIKIPHFEDF